MQRLSQPAWDGEPRFADGARLGDVHGVPYGQARSVRLRARGGPRRFITAGLVVEIAVSAWIHPLAFVTFALVVCPLVAAGMLLFLWSLVAPR